MTSPTPSAPQNSLRILFGTMVVLQFLVLVDFIIEPNETSALNALFHFIQEQRSALLLGQLFGCAILFVDAIIRFDHLKHRWLYCIGIGLLVCHWMFQMFVHFLSSSYLV